MSRMCELCNSYDSVLQFHVFTVEGIRKVLSLGSAVYIWVNLFLANLRPL
jgi:hypothetical protein